MLAHLFGVCTGLRRPAHRLLELRRAYSALSARQCEECTCAATVNEYDSHIFLRTGPSPGGDRPAHELWPPIVERSPGFHQAFSAIAENRKNIHGVVKVTAYDFPAVLKDEILPDGTCDMIIFPAGVKYANIPFDKIKDAIEQHVAEPTEDNDFTYEGPPADASLEGHQEQHKGISLFVCCHAARDKRCGALGPALVERLMAEIQDAGLAGNVHVYECSHVGGHKYAGNVLVFGEISPCHGDWFGNVRPEDAKRFLEALLATPVDSDQGGAGPGPLRTWWRGSMGLSKDDQQRLAAGESLDDGEGEEESEDDSSSSSDEFSSDEDSSGSDSDDETDTRPLTSKEVACVRAEGRLLTGDMRPSHASLEKFSLAT